MKHSIDDKRLSDYLAQLQSRLTLEFADQTEEILYGVREHMADALDRGLAAPEIIAGLGSPEDIAAGMAAQSTGAPRPATPPAVGKTEGYRDSTVWHVLTCILLPFGGFIAGFGWLFGVAGLWMGTRWKIWEKIMGTVILPGGVSGAFLLANLPVSQTLSDENGVVEDHNPLGFTVPEAWFWVALALPLAVAVYLLVVALRRGSSAAATGMRHN